MAWLPVRSAAVLLSLVAAALTPATCRYTAPIDDDHHHLDSRPLHGDDPSPIVLLPDAPNARCLDGSPAAYYYRPYTASENATKWVIYQQGGGWCTSIEDCYHRSLTALGSSRSYAPAVDVNKYGGLLSSDPGTNPMAADWNHVYLPYCDGASFSGANLTTETFNSSTLYFRGFYNLRAIVNDLLTSQALGDATDVIFTGCSAGGLATYLHADYISSLFSDATVVAAPDSGFFLDRDFPEYGYHYHSDLRWVFEQQNCTSGVNADCIAAQTPLGSAWKCMFAEHTAPYIKTPLFPFQSQYDSWQVKFLLGNSSEPVVNAYGRDLSSTFMKSLNLSATAVDAKQLQDGRREHGNGAFLDSCFHHCGQWNNIQIEDDLSSSALIKFFSDVKASRESQSSEFFYFQDKDYKCTDCCGLPSLSDLLVMESIGLDLIPDFTADFTAGFHSEP